MKYKIYEIHMNSYITTYVCCIKEHWYSLWKSVNVRNDLQLTTDSFKWKEYRNVEDNYLRNILNNVRYKKLCELVEKSITKAKSDESK